MPKLHSPIRDTDNKGQKFMDNIRMDGFETQSAKVLADSKSISLFEIQRSLEEFFPEQTPQSLEGIPVDTVVEETRSKLSKSFDSLQEIMRSKSQGDVLSKRLWELAGKKISQQIEKTELTGRIYSEEIGNAYMAHLVEAEKKATKAWEIQNKINNNYLERAAQVKPFLGHLRMFRRPWQRDAVRLGVPIVAGAGVGGLGGAMLFSWMGPLAGKIAAGLGTIAGGVGGFFFPELLQKLKLDQESRRARAQAKKNRLSVAYQPFSTNFLDELKKRFAEYKDIAKEIQTNGKVRADEFKSAISARIEGANDEQRAELMGHLVAIKKNPGDSGVIQKGLRAFSPRGKIDKQFEISFLEALKKIDSVNDLILTQQKLNARGALDKTFTASAKAQQQEFTSLFTASSRLDGVLTDFQQLQNMEVQGRKPFKGIEVKPDEKILSSEEIYRAIRLDLSREGKENDLLKKFSPDIANAVGVTASARLLITLQYLFTEQPKFLIDGTVSLKTKQKILLWIRTKDTDSRVGVVENNRGIREFVERFDKAFEDTKNLQSEARGLEIGNLDAIKKETLLDMATRLQFLSDDLVRAESILEKIKKSMGSQLGELDGILKNLGKQKQDLFSLIADIMAHQKARKEWTAKNEQKAEALKEKIQTLETILSEREIAQILLRQKLTQHLKALEEKIKALDIDIERDPKGHYERRNINNQNQKKHGHQNQQQKQNFKDVFISDGNDDRRSKRDHLRDEFNRTLALLQVDTTKDTRIELENYKKSLKEMMDAYPIFSKEKTIDFLKNLEASREYLIAKEAIRPTHELKEMGMPSKDTLYSRIKGELFTEFESEMNENIIGEIEKIDFFHLLKDIKLKSEIGDQDIRAGKLTIEYIDSAECQSEYTLPLDLDKKKKEVFYISQLSDDKGMWLENASRTKRVCIVRPFATTADKKAFSANAVIVNINPATGISTNHRAGIVTNAQLF